MYQIHTRATPEFVREKRIKVISDYREGYIFDPENLVRNHILRDLVFERVHFRSFYFKGANVSYLPERDDRPLQLATLSKGEVSIPILDFTICLPGTGIVFVSNDCNAELPESTTDLLINEVVISGKSPNTSLHYQHYTFVEVEKGSQFIFLPEEKVPHIDIKLNVNPHNVTDPEGLGYKDFITGIRSTPSPQ